MSKVSSRRVMTRWRILICLAIASLLCYAVLYRSQNYSPSDPRMSVVDLKHTLLGNSNDPDSDSKPDSAVMEEQLYPPLSQSAPTHPEQEFSAKSDDMSNMANFWEEYDALAT